MIRQLIISGVEMDIADVEIVRTYRTPFFTDVEELRNDHTYTVNLPITPKNMAVFGYANREDMYTTKPYDYLYADYYVDGLIIFRNAECRLLAVSDTFEVEFVYGVNRGKYLPLFSRKLNEIRPNGTTILEDDWIVNWNRGDLSTVGMFIAGKKYKYLNYVSGERESDYYVEGADETLVEIPYPYYSDRKEMTMHPFILFNNIIDLIVEDHNSNIDNINITTTIFDELKSSLLNKGIILGGNKSIKTYQHTKNYTNGDLILKDVYISLTNEQYQYISAFVITQSQPSPPYSENAVYLSNLAMYNGNYPIIFEFDITLTAEDLYGQPELHVYRHPLGSSVHEKIDEIPFTISSAGISLFNQKYTLNAERGYVYKILLHFDENDATGATITEDGTIKIYQTINESVYSLWSVLSESEQVGYYDCLINLPDMTAMEFIQQMLIMTGQFLTYNSGGDLMVTSPEVLKTYLSLNTYTNWSGRVSNVKNSLFNFNSNAKINWFKYNNSDDVTHEAKAYIEVNDNTLDSEKDLHVLGFDIADRNNGIAELILYKQRITEAEKSGDVLKSFANEYQSKESAVVYDLSGTAIVEYVKPNDVSVDGSTRVGFVNSNYQTYQKLIRRPIVKEIEINLGFFESANIDFEKPIYIQEWGKYAVLLELTAPDNEVCTAKLLLINQTL